MSDVRPRLQPEKPQQELRFTARDPILDEALALLEKDGERHSDYLPKNLFLFAMKRITIDQSDEFDGFSQNYSTFMQYRQAALNVSNRGQKHFTLDPWLKKLHSGGPGGSLVGVGMRVRVDPLSVHALLAPPLYGANHYKAPVSEEQEAKMKSAREVLRTAREVAYIPVRYEIGNTVDNPIEALERLRSVLELGTWVSHLTIVPSYPRSARLADIYTDPKIARTYNRVDGLFAQELLPATTIPIALLPDADPGNEEHRPI